MYEIWNSNEMKSVSEKRVTTSFRSMSSNDGGMFWKFYWLKTDSTLVTEYKAYLAVWHIKELFKKQAINQKKICKRQIFLRLILNSQKTFEQVNLFEKKWICLRSEVAYKIWLDGW